MKLVVDNALQSNGNCHIRDEKGNLIANVYAQREGPDAKGYCKIITTAPAIAEIICSKFNSD